jgi:PAS domain S-box-containing protein
MKKRIKSESCKLESNIFEVSGSAMILLDAATTIVKANNTFCQLVGLTKANIEGKKSITDFIEFQDVSKVMRFLRNSELTRKRNHHPQEATLITKAKKERHCVLSIASLPKTTIRALSFIDVTHQKHADYLLKQSQEEFKTVFSKAPLGIMVVNKSGVIEQANWAIAKLFGKPLKQYNQHAISQLISDNRLPKELAKVCCPRGARKLHEIRFVTSSGKQQWLEIISTKTTRYTKNYKWIVMIQDISHLVEAKKWQSMLTARILQAHDEEKQLLSQEIHDTFSQSLAAVKMTLQSAHNQKTKPESEINEAIKQVNALIDISRNMANNLRPEIIDKMGLIPAIAHSVDELNRRFTHSIELRCNSSHIDADPTTSLQLFRIAHEALLNAVRHSQAKNIIITINKRHHHLTMTITDNGIGFDQHKQNQGKSLGLKIMSERAGRINAQYSQKSKPGVGTKITVKVSLDTKNNIINDSEKEQVL